MTGQEAEFRRKIGEIHDFVQKSSYLSHEDIKIGGRPYNSHIIFTILTGINRGNHIITGNYGQGKTTVCEAATALIYGFPPQFVEICEIKGHPFQTEEKIFGRPDLGKLNQGKEEVIWSNFSLFPGPKIIDEINRMPEGAQNTLLNTVDRGTIQYLNSILPQKERYPMYATANYPDGGNGQLIPPLLDRFDICTETSAPIGLTFAFPSANSLKELLKAPDVYDQMLSSLGNKNYCSSEISRKADSHEMRDLRESYRQHLEKAGKGKNTAIPYLTDEDLNGMRECLKEISLDNDSPVFLDAFFSDANSVTKVRDEADMTSHYENFLVGRLENNLSSRWINSVLKYSQAVALVAGDESITTETMVKTLPWTMAHRVMPKSSYTQKVVKDEFFQGSQKLYSVQSAVHDFEKDFRASADKFNGFYHAWTHDSPLDSFEAIDIPGIRALALRKKNEGRL